MTTVIALTLWLALLGLAARWPELDRRYVRAILLLGATTILALSSFWQGVVRAAWTGDPVPLLEPSAAFASVWVLVLLPLWHQRLDSRIFASSLFVGLLSLAAIGTALDIGHLAFSRFSFGAGIMPVMLMTVIITFLILTGFTLGCWVSDQRFPWEYAAWCAGLLIMAQPAHPALQQLHPDTNHGLWILAILLIMSCGLERSQRCH